MEGFFIFTHMKSSLFNLVYITLLLCVPFVPYFGTIDMIGSQWFYLSIINAGFFLINFYNNNYFPLLNSFFKYTQFKLYLIFVFFSLFSIIYAINWSVSLVDLSRIIIILFSIIHILIAFNDSRFNFLRLSYLVSLILFFEICYSFSPLIEFLISNELSNLDLSQLPQALKGVSGNRNVLSADLVFKSSFVFYIILKSKGFIRILFMFILFSVSSLIFLLSSRASYLSFSFVFLIFLAYLLFNKFSIRHYIYIALPIFISIFFISTFSYFTGSNSNLISNRLSTISQNDTSTNQRLTLYENAIDYISTNPLIGCGIGNWKIRSLPYWRDKLTGYIIPYHAHNDFLEFTAEIGLFGGVAYFFIFIFIFYKSLLLIVHNKKNALLFLIFSLGGVYFIDAMLNFPFERALSQVNFILLFSLSILIFNPDEKPL